MCTLGFIWGQRGVEVYKRIDKGEGSTFLEMKRTRISFEECGGTMAAYFLQQYMESSHGIVLPHVRG